MKVERQHDATWIGATASDEPPACPICRGEGEVYQNHRANDPGCPCWGCHLNAEAEDATWD